MIYLRNLKIGRRLSLGFGVLFLLLTSITAIGLLKLNAVSQASREMVEVTVAKERMISDWTKQMDVAVVRIVAIAKSSDASLATFFAADTEAAARQSAALLKQIEPMLKTEAEIAAFKKVSDMRAQYTAARVEVMKLKTAGNAEDAAKVADEKFIPIARRFVAAANDLLKLQREYLDRKGKEIEAIEAASQKEMIALSGLALVLSVLCGWFLTTSITGPIRLAVTAARRVADGDLTGTITARTRDEVGDLLQALQAMNANLLRIVSEVRSGTETIATASNEIAAGNQDLSSRTEQQASALEETASSMEELTATVKQNADNARQANQLAITAADVAVKGGQVVAQVVDTMGAIDASSRKIVDIIAVIDGIAFQTNILALNAAVEAARAGEQGRGFAVVATEVRSLAQRSAAAAKEVKDMIGDSVAKVDSGTALVSQAGATMNEVVASIRRVTDIVAEISAASHEQSAGIEQVNQAITQMDQVTQQNAALVEEAAAASEAMHGQSAHLARVVGEFKVGTVDGVMQRDAVGKVGQALALPIGKLAVQSRHWIAHDAG